MIPRRCRSRSFAIAGLLGLASVGASAAAPAPGVDFRAADSLAQIAVAAAAAGWATDSLARQPGLDAALAVLAPHRRAVSDTVLRLAIRSRDLHRARSGLGSAAAVRADVRLALVLDGADRWGEAHAIVLDRWTSIRALGRTDPVLLSDALFAVGRAEHYFPPTEAGIARSDSALAASAVLRAHALGADDPRTGLAFEWLGRTKVRRLRFDEAEAAFARADPGLLRLHGRLLELAEYEVWRGNYLFQQEEHARVRVHYLKAREIRAAALPPDHPDLARAIGLVANVEFRMGRLEVAQSLYRQADAILSTRDPVSRTALVNRSNLGALLLELGDVDEAAHLLEGVFARRERLLPNYIQVAGLTMNLATAWFVQGRNEEALVTCAVADSFYRLQDDRANRIRAYTMWAEILAAVGRTAEARARFALAVEIAEELTDAGDPRRATALDGAGSFHLAHGELVEARRLLERAAASSDSTFGDDHPLVLQRRLNLARLERAEGHAERAAEIALEVEARSAAMARVVIGALSEREAVRYAASRPSGLPLLFDLVKAGEIADSTWLTRVWEAWVPNRTLALERLAERARALRLAEADTLVRRVEDARARYAGLLVRALLDRRGDVFADQLDEARRAFEDAERRAAGQLAVAPGGTPAVTARELAAALPEGSALVSLVAAESDGSARVVSLPQVERSLDGAYLAFLVRPGRATPELVRLAGIAGVDSLLGHWFARARRNPEELVGAARARLEEETRTAGGALRVAVLDPIRARLDSVRELFWVADGALHLLDPVALPARGRGRYVIDENLLFHSLTTERELLRPVVESPGASRLLAVGGVDFDAAQSPTLLAASHRGGSGGGDAPHAPVAFHPLPSSRAEVRELAALWKAMASPAPREVTLLEGSAASEAALGAHAVGQDVVHVATHGIVAGPGSALTGLALAGVGQRASAPSGREDGILTALELAALDLSAAEWLVLSGCETGSGTAIAGEGVFGLRRAGQEAGARIVIASLWPVGDASTRLWMNELYAAHFLRGRSTAVAARDASRALLARRRHAGLSTHPSEWAGFIASGR